MRAWPLVLVLVGAAAALPARAQIDSREGIMLQNQILELRQQLELLQQRPYVDRPPAYGAPQGGGSGLDAQLLERVQTLEDQVRQLRGQLDEQANALRVAQERLGKQIDDLNFKLGNGAGAGATPPPVRPAAPPGLPPPAAPATPRRTPELALQEGNAALARRDYPAAEAAAREALENRTTPRAGDASFLLAQALMGERNYQGAAISYDDAYRRARTGPRAPDALLGLANALTGLGERPAACATLDKLRQEFPSLRSGVVETAASLRSRNGCR